MPRSRTGNPVAASRIAARTRKRSEPRFAILTIYNWRWPFEFDMTDIRTVVSTVFLIFLLYRWLWERPGRPPKAEATPRQVEATTGSAAKGFMTCGLWLCGFVIVILAVWCFVSLLHWTWGHPLF